MCTLFNCLNIYKGVKELERIKLEDHKKYGDTFHTLFTNPKGMGKQLHLSSWSKDWLSEYLWIAMIISKLGRKNAFQTFSIGGAMYYS